MDNTSGSPTDHAQQATGSDDGVERQQQPDSATKSPPDSIEGLILDPSIAEQAASAKRGSFGTSMIVGRVKGQDKGTLIEDVTITAKQGFLSDEPIRGLQLQFLQRLAGAGSTSTEGS